MDADGSNQRRLSTQTSQTSTLMVLGDVVAGGVSQRQDPWSTAGPIDWTNCPADSDGRFDDGSENCRPHAQLISFKVTPSGDEPVAFDPNAVNMNWKDSGELQQTGSDQQIDVSMAIDPDGGSHIREGLSLIHI